MGEESGLTRLIQRGRRRQIRNLLVQQASFSTALALGGAILLLILGTQILDWYWPVLLFVVSLAAGVYRGRNKILSRYRVAQSIDAKLGFEDALSTAYYFREHPGRHASPSEFIEHQREAAENLARSADVRRGLPFAPPRTFYVNAALAVAVFAMFGLRYGINRSLDLRPSLIRIAFDGFLGPSRDIAQAKRFRGQRPFDQDGHREDGQAVDPWESKTADLDPAPDTALDTVDDPEVNNPDGGADSSAKSKANGKEQTPPGDDLLNSPDNKGQPSPSNSDKASDENSSPDGGSPSGKQDAQKNSEQSSSSGENSSLAEKMRDAIANLMAKLKSQPKNSDGKQGGSSAQNSQQSAQRQNQNQPNSKGNSGDQQSENSADSQSQGDQQSQNGAQQSAQGKTEARNSDQTTQDGKSGIGRQDGDKAAREAEQLAAMGKISEIIGKRAANVSGEVMVEVASGKQQLRTQYSQRNATHAESGGEINRDEVPLAYQQYVQQYFEEIHKQPATKKSDTKSKSSAN